MNKFGIEPVLVAKDVAEILNMPLATLKKNVSANPTSVPPSFPLGKNSKNSPRRWRISDVEMWIQEQFEASNPSSENTDFLNNKLRRYR